jgi:hypothetical protein
MKLRSGEHKTYPSYVLLVQRKRDERQVQFPSNVGKLLPSILFSIFLMNHCFKILLTFSLLELLGFLWGGTYAPVRSLLQVP